MGSLVEVELDEISKGSNADEIFKHSVTNDSTTPMVYQLVRVEGDGRMVPATDNEIIEFEHLVEDERLELPLEQEKCPSADVSQSKRSKMERLEESSLHEISEADFQKLNAKLQFIEKLLRKVKQEEQLRLSYCKDDFLLGKSLSEMAQLSSHTFACSAQRGDSKTFVQLNNERLLGRSSFFEPLASFKSDSNGEICLDKLTIRQLQEIYHLTFRRPSNVKDKTWLKRHIAMGLGNSSNDKIANNCVTEKDSSHVVQRSESVAASPERKQFSDQDSSPSSVKVEDLQESSAKRPRKPLLECNENDENLFMEHSSAKRIRKPTKKYLELSEVETRECSRKISSPVQSSPPPQCRTIDTVVSEDSVVVTVQEAVGGYAIQLPSDCRFGEGVQAKNMRLFLYARKFPLATIENHPVGISECLVEKALGNDECVRMMQKVKGIPRGENIIIPDDGKQQLDKAVVEQDQEKISPSADCRTEDSELIQCSSTTRRNNHHAWTLCEVMKLIDGVAKYGAGRWSEIKRLLFASYSYRSSVDLKDKWRNLLKASFSSGLERKVARTSRKNASISLPAPILLRVRELAEMQQSRADNGLGLDKLSVSSPVMVQGKGYEFL